MQQGVTTAIRNINKGHPKGTSKNFLFCKLSADSKSLSLFLRLVKQLTKYVK
jgi:hypothetical protein